MQEDSNGSFLQDLGKITEIIFRQWLLIVGITLICTLSAVLAIIIIPKSYQAEVLAASTKVSSSVSFGSEINTLTEDATKIIDLETRLQSYLNMVENPTIAIKVLAEIQDQLDEEERTVGYLLEIVEGEVAGRSDSIRIIVNFRDPVLAAEIANAWGYYFVEHVNYVYSNGGTDEAFTNTEKQTSEAKKEFDEVKALLENYIAENRSAALSRQIVEYEAKISNLVEARNLTLATIVGMQSIAYEDAYKQRLQDLQMQLSDAYNDRRRVDQLLMDAEDMRSQIAEGGQGAASSNALALNLLKIQAFAANEGMGNLELNTTSVSFNLDDMVADLDGLIITLENRRFDLNNEIEDLSGKFLDQQNLTATSKEKDNIGTLFVVRSVENMSGLQEALEEDISNSPLEQKIQEYEQIVRDLNAELSYEQTNLQELEQSSDLAWQTYKSLVTKEAEIKVAIQSVGSELTLAVPASTPINDTRNGGRNVILASIVGFSIGLFTAFAIEFWWNYKGINPHPVFNVQFKRKKI